MILVSKIQTKLFILMKTLHETNARKNHQQVSLVQQLVHTSIKREVD